MPRPRKSSYGEDKPPYSYVALCAMAIHSSPARMMTLSQIYKFIMDNFPFYRKNSTRWQNSLRHNLSFNDCFVKVSKTSEHGGKGNYWTLHQNCTEMFQDGSFLRRKRRFLSKEDEDQENLLMRNERNEKEETTTPSPTWQSNRSFITTNRPHYLPLKYTEIDGLIDSANKNRHRQEPATDNKITRHHVKRTPKSFSIADILEKGGKEETDIESSPSPHHKFTSWSHPTSPQHLPHIRYHHSDAVGFNNKTTKPGRISPHWNEKRYHPYTYRGECRDCCSDLSYDSYYHPKRWLASSPTPLYTRSPSPPAAPQPPLLPPTICRQPPTLHLASIRERVFVPTSKTLNCGCQAC